MDWHPQPVFDRPVESVAIGGVQMGLLGRVSCARGVQIVAVGGMLNNKVENHFTTTLRLMSYLPRIPADGVVSVDRRPPRPSGPLSFLMPGVPTMIRAGGPLMGTFCIFDPGFFKDLSETDSRLGFNEVDFLIDIGSERLAYLGRTMLREAIKPGFASSVFAEAMGMAIALEIARYDRASRSDEGGRGRLALWQMRRLESYVRDHLSGQLNLSELARLHGISVRHLSRTVREAKGMSVHRWIAECRVAEARRLLAETELPVHEVAQRSAFHSAAAFSTAFRAASGFTPNEFRRLNMRGS
jgi:AraC family transcriptional regulator